MHRQPPSLGPDTIRYRLPGAVPALGCPIGDSEGRLAYRLEREGSSPGAAMLLCDSEGTELFRIDAPALHLRDALTVQSGSEMVVVIRKVLEPPFREEFRVEAQDEHVWHATGRIAAGAYDLREGAQTVATVKAVRVGTGRAFDVLVGMTQDPALALIVVVAINELAAPRGD